MGPPSSSMASEGGKGTVTGPGGALRPPKPWVKRLGLLEPELHQQSLKSSPLGRVLARKPRTEARPLSPAIARDASPRSSKIKDPPCSHDPSPCEQTVCEWPTWALWTI